MHEKIYFNGELLTAKHAVLAAVSSAALYGKGIFTTVAIYNGKPFLWEKHWRRLRDNSAKLAIDLSKFSEGSTKNALEAIIEKNRVSIGRARITFFDQNSSGVWHFESEQKTSLMITTADWRPVAENFRIEISMNRISSLSKLAAIKSCNYLDNILAFEETKRRGYSEAIRLNERGEVAGACMANIFWLKDGKLFTPSLKTGCLPGTTREFILENIECEEVEEADATIHPTDAVFLTSAGLGVVVVEEIEGKKLSAIDHPILHLLPQNRNTNIRENNS